MSEALNRWLQESPPSEVDARLHVQEVILGRIVKGQSEVTLPSEYGDLPMPNLLHFGFTIRVDPPVGEHKGPPEFPKPVVKIPESSPLRSLEQDIANLADLPAGANWKTKEDRCISVLEQICQSTFHVTDKLHLLQVLAARVNWLGAAHQEQDPRVQMRFLAGAFFSNHLDPELRTLEDAIKTLGLAEDLGILRKIDLLIDTMEPSLGDYIKDVSQNPGPQPWRASS